jgi:hypothetical protein
VAVSTLARSSISTFDKFNKTSGGNLVAGPAMFVMGGPYTSSSSAATSNDGITWTLRSLNNFGSSYGVTKIGSFYASIRSTTLTLAADPTVNSTTQPAIALVGVNGGFVGADFINNGLVYYTDEGIGFDGTINRIATSGVAVRAVAFGNNTWVANYYSSTKYSVATNNFSVPLTFSNASNGLTQPEKLIFANGLFVCTGLDGISTSPDGITWTIRSTAGNFQGGRLVYTGGLFFAAINGGNLFTSPNGITWTSRSPVFSSSQFIGAAFGAGIYSVLSSTGQLWSSPDGVTWTTRTNPLAGGNWWTGSTINGPSMIYYG